MRFQTEKSKEQRRWLFAKAQSAVEFAIVVPVLALMLVVIANFARLFFVSVAVNNAARAGAQYGSQSVSTASDTSGMHQGGFARFRLRRLHLLQLTQLEYADRIAVHLHGIQSADRYAVCFKLLHVLGECDVRDGQYFSNL